MKFNELWLRKWVNPPINTKTLADQLTMAGLEVEQIDPVAGKFTGVVVGLVLSAEQHPNADRLRVCQVDVGEANPLSIVCGGVNVRANLKVAVATVGAVLTSPVPAKAGSGREVEGVGQKASEDFVIKPAKLRGVVSQGMICSAQELGLDPQINLPSPASVRCVGKEALESAGILELPDDAPIGKNFREYWQLDDHTIHVNLTPNRGDCLSIFGVAREVAAITASDYPVLPEVETSIQSSMTFPVEILAPEDCPHYVGRVVEGIDLNAQTPFWLKEHLRRSGFRAINLAVDVTNYILLELGQPLHAFDLDQLNDSIVVRRASSDETLTLLDEKTVQLNAETLIIADKKGPLAIAGIMGGLDSAITTDTKNVFLESAFFAPLVMAGRARKYGLSTEASHRFERFVSPELQIKAIERATQLLIEIGGGKAGPLTVVRNESFIPKAKIISLRKNQIPRLLGIDLSDEKVEELLQRLNIKTLPSSSHGREEKFWQVEPPLYRYDLQTETDLIEEIARIYGYDNIFLSPASGKASDSPLSHLWERSGGEGAYALSVSERKTGGEGLKPSPLPLIQNFFAHRGYQEAINYSFIDPQMHRLISPNKEALKLENPISSELSVMRASLWPGLLQAAMNNQRHQQSRIRFFETGLCFQQNNGLISQPLFLGGIVMGEQYPEQWGCAKTSSDFFDVKNDIENLFATFGQKETLTFQVGEHPALHPGQTAAIFMQDQLVGHVGALHPQCLQELDIEGPVILFEIDVCAFNQKQRGYRPFSKFPSVRRDIALIVEKNNLAADLLRTVRSVGGEILQDAWVFDVYMGKGIDPSQKSIAIGLWWQHAERTLLDEEIAEKMQAITDQLNKEYGAILRS